MDTGDYWLDRLDMDLPAHINLAEALGDTANTQLWTFAPARDDGHLNHPAVWNALNMDQRPPAPSMYAYFGLDDTRAWLPAGHITDQPLVTCTLYDAVRVAWPSNYRLMVDRVGAFDGYTLRRVFSDLMGHVRRWHNDIAPARAAVLWGQVTAQVEHTATVVRGLLEARLPDRDDPPPAASRRRPRKVGAGR